jgi:hypothetical protein
VTNRDRPEVFRGHLEECLKHLAKRLDKILPPGSKNVSQLREPMANFCGAKDGTIQRWLFAHQLPGGTLLLKLWCFLDLIGYRVIELERLPKVRRAVAELIGFGLLSATDVAKFVGYASEHQLYRLFFDGDKGTTGDRDEKMLEIYKQHKDALEGVRIDRDVEFPPVLEASTPVLPIPAPTLQDVPVSATSPLQEGAIDLMQALLKMLDSGAFANPSNGLEAKLQASKTTVVRLTAHLSKLSAHCLEVQ